MKTYAMAWRNLWRNRARTILTASIVLLIVILSAAMSSQQYGMYDKMIDNIIEYSGHLQIQDTAYKENKTINHSMLVTAQQFEEIENTEHVISVAPRMESFALASFTDKTKGVAVIGIDSEKEKELAKLDEKIIQYTIPADYPFPAQYDEDVKYLRGQSFISKESISKNLDKVFSDSLDFLEQVVEDSKVPGSYLEEGSNEVIIGEKLAKYLEVGVGDTLVMISQGYHGVSAAALYPIKGLLKLPLAELERRIVFMNISTCQEFYTASDMLTSMLITVDSDKNKDDVAESLDQLLPKNLTVETWEELQPEMVQMIESDKAGGIFMKGIFYMIISFIIFGTIVMVMAERRKEFGVMVSIGMHKLVLLKVLFFETLYISLLGTIVGLGLSFPVVYLMHKNPIALQGEMAEMMEDYGFEAVIYFSNSPEIFYTQAIIVFAISMVVYLFPIFKIKNLNPIQALRS